MKFFDNMDLVNASFAALSNLPVEDTFAPVQRYNYTGRIFFCVFGFFFIMLTLGGNVMVVLAYYRNTKLRTITNLFLVSLSISDIIVAMGPLTFYLIFVIYGEWRFGRDLCDLYLVMDYVCCQVSVNHLVIICFDRYRLIAQPIKYKVKRTTRTAYKVLAVAWLVAVLQWTPWIMAYPYIVGRRTVPANTCYVQFIHEKWYLSYLAAAFAYWGPVAVIVVVYVKMYALIKLRVQNLYREGKEEVDKRKLAKYTFHFTNLFSRKAVSSHQTTTTDDDSPSHGTSHDEHESSTINHHEKKSSGHFYQEEGVTIPEMSHLPNRATVEKHNLRKHQRAAKMLVIVCAAFAFIWLPYNVHVLLAPFCTHCFPPLSWNLSYLLCYLNSTVNPICYAWGSPGFRNEFKKILRIGRKNIANTRTGTKKNGAFVIRRKDEKIENHQNKCQVAPFPVLKEYDENESSVL